MRGVIIIIVLGLIIGLVDSAIRPINLGLSASGDGHAVVAPHAAAAPPPTTQPSPELPGSNRGSGFVGIKEAKAALDRGATFFVDARAEKDFRAGHLPGALLCPPDRFYAGAVPDIVNMLPRGSPIIVYCGGGDCDASTLVALRLREFGFSDVSVCEQGYTGWTAAGLPVEATK